MPNFDGTGPLKRGRIIGRGMGHCKNRKDPCMRADPDRELQDQKPQDEESASE